MAKSKSSGGASTGTPFATVDGRPQGQGDTGGAGGLDVLKDPAGRVPTDRPRDYVSTSDRRQVPARPVPIPNDLANQSRRQPAPIDARQRVSPTSIPSDGSTHAPAPAANAPAWRAGTGSVGNDRRPFKLNGEGGGGAKPAAPARASGSDSASNPLGVFARKPVPGSGR